MKKIILSHFLFLIPYLLFAQNIGIGTSTPQSKLHIISPASEALRLDANQPYLSLYHNGVYTGYFWRSPNSIEIGSAAGSDLPVTLSPNGVQRFFVNPNGNVGIGTSNPLHKLQIEGFTYINGFLGIQNSNPTTPLSFPPDLGKKITLYPGATGDVGLGVQGNLLQIYSDNPNADIAFGYDQSNTFFEKMRVKANGNVGIGTSSPAQKLDVDGTIRIRQGNPGLNKVLISDASGNARWETFDFISTGNIGFGSWGIGMDNISSYHPVGDDQGMAGDGFGMSVSISGNYAVIGSFRDDIGSNYDQGSASIYQYNGSNWVFIQKITDAAGAAGDCFGYSVSISGDWIVVGSPYDDFGSLEEHGSICIFQRVGSSWVFVLKYHDITGGMYDAFGFSVCISGINLAVGAPTESFPSTENGTVTMFQFNGTTWALKQKLTDGSGLNGKHFGWSVSLSGSHLVIGAPDDNLTNTDQGSVYTYDYNGSSWAFVQKIINSSGDFEDRFGFSVSVSGNHMVVGELQGAAGGNTNMGLAHFYQFNGTNWTFSQTVSDLNGQDYEQFGYLVSMSGDYTIVGTPGANCPQLDRGTATIYRRVGAGWQVFQYTKDPAGLGGDRLSHSCSMEGNTGWFALGAPDFVPGGKVVFGKIR